MIVISNWAGVDELSGRKVRYRGIIGTGKLRMAVHPSNKARTAVKLCQNAFQTIPDLSFFDPRQNRIGFVGRFGNQLLVVF